VTRRKVSGGTRSDVGRDCRNAFLGLAKTCAKLAVAFWDYLGSRLSFPISQSSQAWQILSVAADSQRNRRRPGFCPGYLFRAIVQHRDDGDQHVNRHCDPICVFTAFSDVP
jgi:hypothetical protein